MKTQLLSTAVFSSSEIQIHYKRPLYSSMVHITCAEDADRVLREFLNPNQLDLKECFWVLLLSRASRLLGISLISVGEVSGVAVNIKEIFQLSLLTHASSVIVAHNHPSGNLEPSKNDIKMTEKIAHGLSLLEVTLLDHIVITSEGFTSFANDGLL